jgi:hypothetical protein
MYGNSIVGKYDNHQAALDAAEQLKASSFSEFYIEIIPVSKNHSIVGLGG